MYYDNKMSNNKCWKHKIYGSTYTFENRTCFQTHEGNGGKKKNKNVTVEIGSLYRKEKHFFGS